MIMMMIIITFIQGAHITKVFFSGALQIVNRKKKLKYINGWKSSQARYLISIFTLDAVKVSFLQTYTTTNKKTNETSQRALKKRTYGYYSVAAVTPPEKLNYCYLV